MRFRSDPTSQDAAGSVVKIDSPVLNAEELAEIAATPFISMQTLSTVYPIKTALSVGGLQVGSKCMYVCMCVMDYKRKVYSPELIKI